MKILSELQQKNIVHTIYKVEEKTTGEIKVHIEDHCPTPNPSDRAVEIFHYLSLQKTALRNGVLIYLAHADKKFAIIGDHGINTKVDQNFWDSERQILLENFKIGDFENGFVKAIEEVGRKLQHFFPVNGENKNELPNDISFG